MIFNSLDFALFLPIVFILYWFVTNKSLTLQNILLLVSSYFFYAFWDPRFLLLLMFSTFLDYFTGIRMHDANGQKWRKFWFWLSISVNVGFLAVFKYYNFFAESFAGLLENVGLHVDVWTLQIILPVGISFYTFHGLSYVIDIYKELLKPNIQPTKQWLKSKEVRKLLNISPGTLQTLRINKTLSYTKIGGILYYNNADIEKLLSANKVTATPTLFK